MSIEKKDEGDNSEYVKEKRAEYSRNRIKYQFLLLLSQFILNSNEDSYKGVQSAMKGGRASRYNRDLADVLATGNSNLCSDSDETLFNIHHITPLELLGTNDFSNLCLIHTKLHNYIHYYCFSKDVLRMLRNPTAYDRNIDVTQFIPVVSPVARIADSFKSAVICSIRSACYFSSKDKRSDKMSFRPISADVVRSTFDKSTLRFVSFKDEVFFDLVNCYKAFYKTVDVAEKAELQNKINIYERRLATSCMPEQAILDTRRLWLDKCSSLFLEDLEGADLIKQGALPKQIMTAKTQAERATLRKMLAERERN